MPIDDEEWAAGRTETGAEGGHVKEKLLEYLELNETRAYTADELAKVYAREVAGDAVTGKDPEGISPDDGRAIYDRKKELNGDANDALKDLADRAGINKNASFHLSRNAAAWYLNQNVRDIYKVRDFLGHSSVEQTERYLDGFEDDA